jgi:hypothetical protein
MSLIPLLLWGSIALGHHSVISVYDDHRRFTIEVEVLEFELIDPHPLLFVEVIDIPGGQTIDDVATGQTWTLEMDNARELRALGFHNQTFLLGDRMLVAVDPPGPRRSTGSRASDIRYRKNTLYLRGAEHRREGFIYLHNARQLLPRESTGDSLPKYLDLIR